MAIMPDYMRLTPEQHKELADIRVFARNRHEKERRAAEKRGETYPELPYECTWAYEEEFRRKRSRAYGREDDIQENARKRRLGIRFDVK